MIGWKDFLFAGNAHFTLTNDKTGGHFTYRVKKHKEKDLWFVSVMNGPDNNSNYMYIGTWDKPKGFRITRASKVKATASSFKVFDWLVRRNEPLPEHIKFQHVGRCCRCGRLLTHPESIELGIGPECAGRVNFEAADTVDARKLQERIRKLKSLLDKEVSHEV